MQGIKAVVLRSLSSSSLALTLNLTLPSLGILSNLPSWSHLALRVNIFDSTILGMMARFTTPVANILAHKALSFVVSTTFRTWRKMLHHRTLVLVEPWIRNIGPLPLWLLTTTTSTFGEITFTSSPLKLTHFLLLHILPFYLLHMSHQSSNVHLRVQHSRSARILKSVIQPGHK